MTRSVLAVAFCVLAGLPAAAGEAPAKAWSGSLGLSYLATTGNSDTRSAGLELSLKRRPDPWGVEIAAKYLNASKDGTTNAERTFLGAKATRALVDGWSVLARVSGERDTFAGFDLRAIVEGGMAYKALAGPVHTLALDAGVTWTRENPVAGGGRQFAGGALGGAYQWTLSKTSAFTEKLRWFEDFSETANWRATSETALVASLTDALALKAGYEARYSHRPLAGYGSTDTASTVSLVASF